MPIKERKYKILIQQKNHVKNYNSNLYVQKYYKHETNNFRFYESHVIDYEKILDVLKGKIPGCIFRNVISKNTRQKILKNFWESPILDKRKDEVPAYNLGAFHFDKYLNEYFNEVEKSKIYLKKLFNGVENVHKNFIYNFENFLLKKNIHFRQAKYFQKCAGEFLVRSCRRETGEYIIKPHEDMAQCKNNKQSDFEIQNVCHYNIIAGNICLQNDNNGDLYYWDFIPSDIHREKLDIVGIGYPYPSKFLEDIPYIKIPIFPGDFYFFNGGNIHAVKTTENNEMSFRTTLSFFMGFISRDTIVKWS